MRRWGDMQCIDSSMDTLKEIQRSEHSRVALGIMRAKQRDRGTSEAFPSYFP